MSGATLSVIVICFVQILVDAVIASLTSKVNQNPSRGFPSLGHTEAAVTNLATWRTHPFWVPQRLGQPLPIPILQAGGAELTSDPSAVLVVADGLDVLGLLATLMAGGAVDAVVHLGGATLYNFDVTVGRVGGDIVQLDGKLIDITTDPSTPKKK